MKAPSSETVSLTIRVVLRRVGGHWHVASQLIEPHHDGWPDEPEAFGHAIRLARLHEGIGVDEFAELVGVTPQTIRNIETARNPATTATRGWIVGALAKLGQPPQKSINPKGTSTEGTTSTGDPDE